MRELENAGGEKEGSPKENFRSFSCNINLTDKQRGLMYQYMNEGKIGFLLTYVELLKLNPADSEKLKRLINEWPKEIAISDIKSEERISRIPSQENQKLMNQAKFFDDGTYELIPEGPPVEEVDMIDHLREQSKAISSKDDLIAQIVSLETTKDHKITLIKYLERKYINGKPKR